MDARGPASELADGGGVRRAGALRRRLVRAGRRTGAARSGDDGRVSYIRLHAGEVPGGGFSDEQDVYAYFNNDREGHAVRDAARLLGHLRLAR